MKNLTLFSILTVFLLVFFSCKKDEVIAPIDPCAAITCNNGGTCANGQCDCPENYMGGACDQQVTPSAMKIKYVDVLSFPPVQPDGSGWDFGTAPDIYVQLQEGNTIIYKAGDFRLDAVAGPTYRFVPVNNLKMTNVKNQHKVRLYDNDTFTDAEWMGGYNFTPYNDVNGFPTVLSIGNSSQELQFEIGIEYEF